MSTTATMKEPAHRTLPTGSSPGLAIGIAAVILAAHVPLLFVHFQQLWLKPHYQLFPLVLAGAIALLWPLDHFSYVRTPGGLKWAMVTAIAGGVLVGIGQILDWIPELSFLGSAGGWVAVGGIVMFAAIPITIFTGFGTVYSIGSSPVRGVIAAFGVSLLLLFCAFFLSPSGAAASWIILCAVTAYTAGGWPLLRRCLMPILYLFLIVPPLFDLDTKLVQKLQVFASALSSKLLDQMGVFHQLNGVRIEVGSKLYMVEDACSGINSLLSTLAVVLFCVIYFRIHWLRAILLTLFSIGWVIVSNTLRIITITFFGSVLDINLSEGLPHSILGAVLFVLTLFMIWSTDRLLMFFGRSDPPHRRYEPIALTSETATKGLASLLSLGRSFYRSIPLAAVFGAILAVQLAERIAMARHVPYSGSALSQLYQQIDFGLLPKEISGWERLGDKIHSDRRKSGNPLGEFSQGWAYRRMQGTAVCAVSLDYPFPEYHDLRVCYSNEGWQMNKPQVFKHATGDKLPDLTCVRVGMTRPVEQYGYLWFCEFDQDGVSLDPITEDLSKGTFPERLAIRFQLAGQRWQRLFAPGETTAAKSGLGSILQIQLMFRTKQEKSQAELETLNELFTQAATKLRARCVELKSGKK